MRPRILPEDRPPDHLAPAANECGAGAPARDCSARALDRPTTYNVPWIQTRMPSHYLALWEFQVKPEFTPDFEATYGPDGAWAQLFRQSLDYLGTKLLRDLNHPGRYLTIDHWTSRESLHRFKKDNQPAYTALDKQCERLTERETFLGDFEDIAPHPEP